jgi:hypothetical protein
LREGPPIRKPRALELDYLVPRRRPLWPGFVVLALSVALAAGLLERYRAASIELAGLDAAAGLLGAVRAPTPPVPRELLDEGVRNAEAVARQLALPWAALVHAIERAATREVALLQLQPDADKGVLRLTAEARNRAAMFGYVRRLAAAKHMSEVHLVSHQVQREDPRRPVQFTLQAALRSAQ